MYRKNHITFKKVSPTHPELPAVLADSLGAPSSEAIQKALGLYKSPDHYLRGCFEGDKLIGVIGLKIEDSHCLIKHLAVLEEYRLKGVGNSLIKCMVDEFSPHTVQAETDNDAVNFYRRCGFICKLFIGKYGKRYTCDYKLEGSH